MNKLIGLLLALPLTSMAGDFKTFTRVHDEYCTPPTPVTPTLLLADGFVKLQTDIYGKTFDGVSYAVSIDRDGCSTDVMLEGSKTASITLESMLSYLQGRGMSIASVDEDTLRDGTVVITVTYQSGATLDYPIDGWGNFYMALFEP